MEFARLIRVRAEFKTLASAGFCTLSEMCFWGAKVFAFSQRGAGTKPKVPLVLKQWGGANQSTQVDERGYGNGKRKVLAVNSMARIEHVEIIWRISIKVLRNWRASQTKRLVLAQLLASAFSAGKTRIMMTCDPESLDTLLRTLQKGGDLRKQRETLSSVSLTCFGGVSSDLPFKAIQILQRNGIIADKYLLSPHSVNLFVPVESREAAVKVLHSLLLGT